ncbi:hypothetical protein [Natranaeroarchaeum sulfidigenes]|uniref:Uncharacterized protein n=1 Tax=Natranaeroarchaeum sulfidigenes TaxID=2784880 RepID=A0A897MYN8_9EURY|nr:hypothetical protein [Natranaeroarchaeum sulfidigenes]QSG04009.1 hypothetical protein AArcS_2817 [Natranaeroarchaeum sulfidigenes]
MVPTPTDDADDRMSASRRRVMAAGGAAFASVAVAGCTGDDNGDENGDENGAANDDENGDEENEVLNYVVTDDLIAGSAGAPDTGFAQSCSPTRQFMPGMQAVFKIGIYDPETGDPVDNETVDEAVVEIGDDTVELEHGEEGEDDEFEWSGNWMIPDDQDPGTVEYVVEVTNEGQYQNVGIYQGELEVIEGDDPRNYVVTDDVWAGSEEIPDDANGFAQACAPQNQFRPGMQAVFKVGVYDGTTGEMVGPDTLDEVTVDVDGFDTVELGTEDEDDWDDDEWDAGWIIPDDAEEGTVEYTVEVTNEGVFYNVGVSASEIEII